MTPLVHSRACRDHSFCARPRETRRLRENGRDLELQSLAKRDEDEDQEEGKEEGKGFASCRVQEETQSNHVSGVSESVCCSRDTGIKGVFASWGCSGRTTGQVFILVIFRFRALPEGGLFEVVPAKGLARAAVCGTPRRQILPFRRSIARGKTGSFFIANCFPFMLPLHAAVSSKVH
ncbi:unnamed protein product [Hapterophycus canaliculatus]